MLGYPSIPCQEDDKNKKLSGFTTEQAQMIAEMEGVKKRAEELDADASEVTEGKASSSSSCSNKKEEAAPTGEASFFSDIMPFPPGLPLPQFQ